MDRRGLLQSQTSRRVLDLVEDLGGIEEVSGAARENAHRNPEARPVNVLNPYGARGRQLNRRESVRNLTAKNEKKRVKLLDGIREQTTAGGGGAGGVRSMTPRDMEVLEELEEGLDDSMTTASASAGLLGHRSRSSMESSDHQHQHQHQQHGMAMMDDTLTSHFEDDPYNIGRNNNGMDGSHKRRISWRSPLGRGSILRGRKDHNNAVQVTGKVEGRDIFEGYDDKLKQSNSKFRWNLIWLLWCFVCPYPLWLTFVDCRMAFEITIVVNIIMVLNFVYTTTLCWRYMWKMIRSFNTPFWQELDPDTRDKVKHVVILPTYKEPLEILTETLSSIANQTIASRLIVVVGMEEKTPNQAAKKQQLTEQFGECFLALVYSVHPYGVPGEIQGACSNRNYASRYAVKYMLKEGLLPFDPDTLEVDLDFSTVTVCDADTTFHYRYFENLTYCFLKEPPKSRYEVCWQSPLFYNISLDQRWFFTRVMGILRSYFMVGFLIGWDINTMSIYSQSLKLLIDSRYFHPGYQMDDIIYTLSAMKSTGKRIRIRTIDIPTLSGPTSGINFQDEFREWAVQAARWTIGAAEVFHYFTVKMLRGYYLLPGLSYFLWFVYYYIFILSGSVLINLSNMIIQIIGAGYTDISIGECKPFVGILGESFPYYGWIMPAFAIYTYVTVGGTAFFMDALVSQILALDENIHPLRNFVHWMALLPVWWMYGIVKFKSICKIAIYGKDACGHVASEKHALAGIGVGETGSVDSGSESTSSKKEMIKEHGKGDHSSSGSSSGSSSSSPLQRRPVSTVARKKNSLNIPDLCECSSASSASASATSTSCDKLPPESAPAPVPKQSRLSSVAEASFSDESESATTPTSSDYQRRPTTKVTNVGSSLVTSLPTDLKDSKSRIAKAPAPAKANKHMMVTRYRDRDLERGDGEMKVEREIWQDEEDDEYAHDENQRSFIWRKLPLFTSVFHGLSEEV